MTNFIRIFPLGIVVYPGESLNLHIFEDRYIQLVNECHTEGKPFGVPPVLGNTIKETGTLVEITEITEVLADGSMNIRTRGLSVFKILEIVRAVPGKQYNGAIVNHPPNDITERPQRMSSVLAGIRQLHEVLKVSKVFPKPDRELTSYDVAHHASLSPEQEYELLELLREDQRLEYLKRHLKKVLPLVGGIEALKERIQLNGHFKELKGFDLDL
ncbi:LON peptidase substrate-binding domain-containing protein [Filimonas effusa]|uniref:Peptidase S16 n=1 Tax=Filimonas effusa TaxID=2508721 RepID=A0A4Q1D1T0_9BACT|nr:LON peptidase substrate-binding domain-containing protein [Filimonas effusa]RXK80939.1 peptidase S16 [Filimonas effusa]